VTGHLITVSRQVVADLKVPRMHPCEAAGTGPGAQQCGATPASLWRRYCANGHSREVWLCGTHAAVITRGMGACADCADRGTAAAAMITPVDLLWCGHAGDADRRAGSGWP
jgi:hypothetical protein